MVVMKRVDLDDIEKKGVGGFLQPYELMSMIRELRLRRKIWLETEGFCNGCGTRVLNHDKDCPVKALEEMEWTN